MQIWQGLKQYAKLRVPIKHTAIITYSIKNASLHMMAIGADGFYEVASQRDNRAAKTRSFTKVHNDGLLIETQRIDTSPPPGGTPPGAAPGGTPSGTASEGTASGGIRPGTTETPVTLELQVNEKLLAQATENMVEKRRKAGAAFDLSASLSEYKSVLDFLKKYRPQLEASQPSLAKPIQSFLAALSETPT